MVTVFAFKVYDIVENSMVLYQRKISLTFTHRIFCLDEHIHFKLSNPWLFSRGGFPCCRLIFLAPRIEPGAAGFKVVCAMPLSPSPANFFDIAIHCFLVHSKTRLKSLIYLLMWYFGEVFSRSSQPKNVFCNARCLAFTVTTDDCETNCVSPQ